MIDALLALAAVGLAWAWHRGRRERRARAFRAHVRRVAYGAAED